MRTLVVLLLVVFAGYSGWWFYGQNARITAIESWLSARDADGWVTEGEFTIKGFPNRFDTTFDDVILSNPNRDWSIKTAQFHLAQLSYRPNHLIALWPAPLVFATPDHKITINGDDVRASVAFEINTQAVLDRTVFEGHNVTLSGSDGALHGDHVLLAMRQSPTNRTEYVFDLNVDGARLGDALRQRFNISDSRPNKVDQLSGTLGILYNEPIGLRSFEFGTLEAQRLSLRDLHIRWANMEIRAKGELLLDARGYPDGRLTLQLRNWLQMIDFAVEIGISDESLAQNLQSGLEVLTMLSGQNERLEVPLNFSDGVMYLGPIPIGPAPILKLNAY